MKTPSIVTKFNVFCYLVPRAHKMPYTYYKMAHKHGPHNVMA